MHKSYQEVEQWLTSNIEEEGDCGVYVKIEQNGEEDCYYLYRYYGFGQEPKEPLYVYDAVCILRDEVDTFHVGPCSELFKTGTEKIEIVSEKEVYNFLSQKAS